MELHRFYLNILGENGERKMEPILYAFTNDEDLAEEFSRTRKKEMFVYFHSKATKEEYETLHHKYHQKELIRARLKTRSTLDKTKSIGVNVVCTWDENERVIFYQEDIFSQEKVEDFMYPFCQIFSLEVNKALYKLGYFSIYRWLYNTGKVYIDLDPLYSGIGHETVEGSFFDSFKFDELEIFIKLYGNTMRDSS